MKAEPIAKPLEHITLEIKEPDDEIENKERSVTWYSFKGARNVALMNKSLNNTCDKTALVYSIILGNMIVAAICLGISIGTYFWRNETGPGEHHKTMTSFYVMISTGVAADFCALIACMTAAIVIFCNRTKHVEKN